MNKKEMHEALDKTLEAIDTWMQNIQYIRNANWDIKTTIEIGIRKEMIEFNEKLKDDVIAEFKKKVGDKE